MKTIDLVMVTETLILEEQRLLSLVKRLEKYTRFGKDMRLKARAKLYIVQAELARRTANEKD